MSAQKREVSTAAELLAATTEASAREASMRCSPLEERLPSKSAALRTALTRDARQWSRARRLG